MKLIPFSWVKTSAPTVTLTGTVTLLPADWKMSSPMNVPAVKPPSGRLATDIPTLTSDGAVRWAAKRSASLRHPP